MQKLLLRGSQYVVHVTRVSRTRTASRLSRPGAGYSQFEGSGATFEGLTKSRTGRYTDATPSPLSPCLCGVPCHSLEVGP